MNILSKLRQIFLREKGLEKGQFARLRQLPKDERNAELGIILHERCVKAAAAFVQQELARQDSPFKELSKTDFFHEMLVLNFWIFEKLFDDKKRSILDAMYRTYSSSFTWGWESSHKELLDSIQEKHRKYHSNWDELTGHQDLFGEKVTEILFKTKEGVPVTQTSYWIIDYTDKTLKEFQYIKNDVDMLARKKSHV
jgi:hypothetical protein